MSSRLFGPAFQNFPAGPSYMERFWDFGNFSDIADFTWNVSGHSAPTALNDEAFGTLTLGSGSATDDAYVQGQAKGAVCKMGTLGVIYQAEARFKLSDATQEDGYFGWIASDTEFIGLVADGVFFRKPDGAAYWDIVMASGATNVNQYTQSNAVLAADTSYHTFGIQVITDQSTLGKANIVYFVDNVQVGLITTAALPYTINQRLSIGMQNGEAVAKTLTLDYLGEKLPR